MNTLSPITSILMNGSLCLDSYFSNQLMGTCYDPSGDSSPFPFVEKLRASITSVLVRAPW